MKTPNHNDYQFIVRRLSDSDGGGFIAEPIDLPFCGIDGPTQAEAVAESVKSLERTLEIMAERGKRIPPAGDYSRNAFSGNFVLRVPRSLHHRLTLRARAEGVSLNQLCLHLLSDAVSGHGPQERQDGASGQYWVGQVAVRPWQGLEASWFGSIARATLPNIAVKTPGAYDLQSLGESGLFQYLSWPEQPLVAKAKKAIQ